MSTLTMNRKDRNFLIEIIGGQCYSEKALQHAASLAKEAGNIEAMVGFNMLKAGQTPQLGTNLVMQEFVNSLAK